MSNLSNSVGEGGTGGRAPDRFTDTGYGTHDGTGNVTTGAQFEKGTGYDEHGQVATAFGKWPLAYDPVTGMAVDSDSVTGGYDFPAGSGANAGGGLVDVSAEAPSHCTGATPEMQRQVQEFFATRQQQREGQGPDPRQQQPEEETAEEAAGGTAEGTGQGMADHLDARAYLPCSPELTVHEVEAWCDRRHVGSHDEPWSGTRLPSEANTLWSKPAGGA